MKTINTHNILITRNLKCLILIFGLTLTTPSINAQSGSWTDYTSVGTPGYIDHSNGVIQLLDTNFTGCTAGAIHRTNEYNTSSTEVYSECFQAFFGCPGVDVIGAPDEQGDGLAFSFWAGTVAEYNMNDGACGGGLGYDGARPQMVTIEFDTWSSQGAWDFDPAYEGTGDEDQVAIHIDGQAMSFGKLAGANPGNLEDGFEHEMCVSYDPASAVLTVLIDGNQILAHSLLGTAYEFSTYFGAATNLNITWSSGKFGATNPATVTDGQSITNYVSSLCSSPFAKLIAFGDTICPGDSVLLRVQPQNPNYTYEWLINGTPSGPATMADTVKWVQVDGNHSVIVNNGSEQTTSETVPVTIRSTTISNAGNDQTITDKQSATLNANAAAANEFGVWSGGLGTFSIDRNDPNATYSPNIDEINNNQTVLTWSIDNGFCPASSSSMTITINTDSIIPVIQASGSDFCPGDSVQLVANPQDPSYAYEWNLNGSIISTKAFSNSTIWVQSGGSYTVSLDDGIRTLISAEVSITANPGSANITATASTNDPQHVCSGSVINLTATADPVVSNFDWTVITGNGTITNANQSIAAYELSASEGNVVQFVVTGTGGCAPAYDSVNVAVTPDADGNFSITTNDVCMGDAAQITFTATSGTSPFNVDYTIEGSNQTAIGLTDGAVLDFPLTGNTTLLVTGISASSGCPTSLNQTLELTALSPVAVSSETLSCPVSSNYVLSFDIVGGDPISYSVSGANGSFQGNSWTSAPLPNGPYSISVTDGNNCDPIVISGDYSCDCITSVNAMSGTTQNLCPADLANWNFDLDNEWTNDGNDAIIFVLHSGNGNQLLNPIDTVALGNLIPYDPNTMTLGATYYLSPVVGDDNGVGQPTPQDLCHQVGAGLPITFNAAPDLDDLTTTLITCPASVITLDPGSWAAYLWSDGSTEPALDLAVLQNEQRSVEVFDTNGCSSTVTFDIMPSSVPELADQNVAICPGESTTVALVDGFVSYDWSDGSSEQIRSFDSAQSLSVTATNIDNCKTSATSNIMLQPLADIGFATSSSSICYGEDLRFNINIDFAGPGSFDLGLSSDNNRYVTFPGLTVGSNPILLTADHELYPTATTLFTMVVTDTQGCDQTPDPSADQITIEVQSSPSVSGQDVLLCGTQDNKDLVFTLVGGATYDLYYSVNGTPEAAFNIPGPVFSIANPEAGVYLIDSIIGNNGCHEFPPAVTEVLVIQDDFVASDFEYIAKPSCAGIGVEITAASDGDSYYWDFGNGITSTDQYPPTMDFATANDIHITYSVTSINGCSDTVILGNDGVVIYTGENVIPNVFTPGQADGSNDLLTLDPNDFYDGCVQFQVFNRWGEEIFDNGSDLNMDDWDGTSKYGGQAPEGTYYYIYSIADADQATKSVTLFR